MKIEQAIAELTEREKQCLRLVRRDRNSKEIARALGISHHTVNKAVESAMAKLGASDRFRAAEILKRHEVGEPYEWFVDDPLGVSEPTIPRLHCPPTDEGPDGVTAATSFRDVALWNHPPESLHSTPRSSIETRQRRNDLSAAQRAGLVLIYTVAFILAAALLMAIADGLYGIFYRAFGAPA